jgi:hypothetical protein
VARLADDRPGCAALGKKGRVFAAENFNRETLAGRMLDELQKSI